MSKKQILVSRKAVDHNQQTGSGELVFTVIDIDGAEYKTSNLIILGASELRYDPDGEEGRRVWIETFSNIVIKNGTDAETGNPIMATI